MSNSDTINQQQEREEKFKQMDSMCVIVKGKQHPPANFNAPPLHGRPMLR